ncbi:MAG: alanine racemase domain protein [Ignavibacteria bacterium]|nr:alanine racemase domain protein [Ignavibacteria bacterium]
MNQEEQIEIDELKKRFAEVFARVNEAARSANRNPYDIKIVSVSKTKPTTVIKLAIKAGIKIFGENYAQELRQKYDELNDSEIAQPEWHFIGHLQTNKVKLIVPFVLMFHSVDSFHLAEEISKQAEKYNRTIDILLQVNTSGEYSKSGCAPDEIFQLIKDVLKFQNIIIKGLMTIGTFSVDKDIARREFQLLRNLRDEARSRFPEVELKELSMGMTGDFEVAIQEGATYVRVGTAIFGDRVYY